MTDKMIYITLTSTGQIGASETEGTAEHQIVQMLSGIANDQISGARSAGEVRKTFSLRSFYIPLER